MGAQVTGILMFTFVCSLIWHFPKFTSMGDFCSPRKRTLLRTLKSCSHPHSFTIYYIMPLSANGNFALCPLLYLKNLTDSHNHLPFTGPFISPLAFLQVCLSPYWSLIAIPTSVLGPPAYHIGNRKKSLILRTRINSLMGHVLECHFRYLFPSL